MRSLSALFVIGCVAAGAIKPYSWTPSQEYRYKYSTQVLTGIPELNEQYSGLRIITDVLIQPKEDYTLRIQLEEPKLMTYNEVIEWDREVILPKGYEAQIPRHMKTWLETPFTVYHKRGLVEKIHVENGEPEFIVNLKKGLVSQLQYDLSKAELRGTETGTDTSLEPIPVFKTNETTILGECETIYTISKLPLITTYEYEGEESVCKGKEHYQILKTKNLESCSRHPIYYKTFGIEPRLNGLNITLIPVQSSTTRTIICGTLEDYYIKNTTTSNSILTSASGMFDTKEKIDITSFTTLELESVERAQREISEPSSPKGYPSLIFEYPLGSPSSSKPLRRGPYGSVELPDLTSTPTVFHPWTASQGELKGKFVEIFSRIIESAERMTETSPNKKDVAGLSVTATMILGQLNLETLKEVEQTIRTTFEREIYETLVEKVFFDLVSMTGTNPSLMLIKEKIISGEAIEHPITWSFIISNSLRAIKTPTKELIEELVELMKTEHIERSRVIRASYVMGLTELINRACVRPLTIKNEFPYKIYGQMCHKDLPVIKSTLIPYLTEKLTEASKTDMNTVITYINGLGNIGIDESTRELLKVVEGKISTNPHPRSLAVYLLMKPAEMEPSVYRPIFLSIIENPAEDPEVKMAAITSLLASYPSSTDLQRLAMRTWFEPSRQVVSYIYSTLKSLTTLSSTVPEYESLKLKALVVLPMAKPVFEGLQYSRNVHYTTFVESLKTLISHKLQWTASEESFLPKSVFAKTQLKGLSHKIETIESMFYVQGAESVIDRLVMMYSQLTSPVDSTRVGKSEREVEEKMRTLGVKEKKELKPEAHLRVKFLGLQKLYSIDDELVETIINKVVTEINEGNELKKGVEAEYFKILDLFGSEYIFPSESGMPVYLTIKNPLVTYNKGEIKLDISKSQPSGEFRMTGVTNYKRQIHAGVMSSLTEKFHSVGVETSVHLALPLRGEVSYRQGQVHVTLKQTEEPEYQTEHPILEFDVHPFTTAHPFSEFVGLSKGRYVKTIKSGNPELKKEVNIGKPLGLDIKLLVETEELPLDAYKLWEEFRTNVPVLIASPMPLPITSNKRTKIVVLQNPRTSEVKELDLYFTIGSGILKGQAKQAEIKIFDETVEKKIERVCEEYAPRSVEECKTEMLDWERKQESEVVQYCKNEHMVRQLKSQQQQQQYNQFMQPQHQYKQMMQQHYQTQQGQQLHEECLSERHLCKIERKWCIKKLEGERQTRHEAETTCDKKLVFCTMRYQSKQMIQSSLIQGQKGEAFSVSLGAILRGSEKSMDRKVETHIAFSKQYEEFQHKKVHMTIKMEIETPSLRRPIVVDVDTNAFMVKPSYMWSREEILKEKFNPSILITGVYGYKGEEMKTIKLDMHALQSQEHREFVRESPEYRMCSKEESEGRLLTKSCKVSRYQIGSLDMGTIKLYLPIELRTKVTESAGMIVRILLSPFVSVQTNERRVSGQYLEYEIEAKVNATGELLSGKGLGYGEEVEFHNVRLGKIFTKILPICTRCSLTTMTLQKLSGYSTPSSCSIEAGKVVTFDNMTYTYPLNDCEHIVFAEQTIRPRILVSTKKTPQKQIIKMVVDGHKFEVELNKESRYSRGSKSIVRIDGEPKEFTSTLEHLDTIITRYMDGVITIHSEKYGVEIQADGERLNVQSTPLIFRNRVTGLCGNLNGEKIGDLETPKQCIMPVPKLTAMTFMIEDGKCRGVPQQVKPELSKFEQKCIVKKEIPTRVTEVFETHTVLRSKSGETELKHIFEEFGEKICFTKDLVRICYKTYPTEIVPKKVPFTCFSGPKAEVIKRRVIAGERVEELISRPTEFVQTVYEPEHC